MTREKDFYTFKSLSSFDPIGNTDSGTVTWVENEDRDGNNDETRTLATRLLSHWLLLTPTLVDRCIKTDVPIKPPMGIIYKWIPVISRYVSSSVNVEEDICVGGLYSHRVLT